MHNTITTQILAQTCSEAGKSPGCCSFSSTNLCFVVEGRCYCDPDCIIFGDCCDDVHIGVCTEGKMIILTSPIIFLFNSYVVYYCLVTSYYSFVGHCTLMHKLS